MTRVYEMTSSVMFPCGLLLIVLLMSVRFSSSLDQPTSLCPFNSGCSIRGHDFRFVYAMQCNELGDLARVPDACSNSLIVRNLVIGPESTVIRSAQARMLSGFRVVNLDMTGLGIETVDVDAFAALGSELLSLALDSNRLTTLPEGLFKSTTMLSKLQLQNNALATINPRVFEGLTNLAYLDLSGNSIGEVAPGTWMSTPSLTELDLSDNELTSVDGLFANLSTLTSLNLARNPLRVLPEAGSKTFVGLTSLQRLNLSSTCLTSVSFTSAAFPVLEELDLRDNGLRDLAADFFVRLSSLRRVDLGSNDIETIQPGALAPLTNLDRLNLTRNFLSSASALSSALSELTSGPEVDLAWNYLTSVEDLSSSLGAVYMHGNPIRCGCVVPTWMTSNPAAFRDLDVTMCLLAENNTAELLFCHWVGCPSSLAVQLPVGASCSVPSSADSSSYLIGRRRSPFSCPWDSEAATTTEAAPHVGFVDVETDSPTSVLVRWNVTGDFGVRVLITPGNATADGSSNSAEGHVKVGGTVDFGPNETECVIDDLISGELYTVCVGVLDDTYEPSSYVCKIIALPVLPPVEIRISATATDAGLLVSWSLVSGAVTALEYFRLTWKATGSDRPETVWLAADNFAYVVSNLQEETEYQVCVQAIAVPNSEVDNTTVCIAASTSASASSTTLSSSTRVPASRTAPDSNAKRTIIITVAVSIGSLFLLVLIVVVVVDCRRRRKTEDQVTGHVAKVTPISLHASESMKSTQSINTRGLAEHGEVSLNVYDDEQ